jgi:hypothetical protein
LHPGQACKRDQAITTHMRQVGRFPKHEIMVLWFVSH